MACAQIGTGLRGKKSREGTNILVYTYRRIMEKRRSFAHKKGVRIRQPNIISDPKSRALIISTRNGIGVVNGMLGLDAPMSGAQ